MTNSANIFLLQKKWDGHTHSEFCPHGNKEQTSLMIEKAISLGFKKYSITEHAPLPPKLLAESTTPNNASMTQEQLPNYFTLLQKLKNTYASKIEILIGLEVDYLLGMEDFTQKLLTENEKFLDEIVYSLHFLPNKEGSLKIIDRSDKDWKIFFANYSTEKIWEVYWKTMEKMLVKKWQFSKPVRLAHLALIEKYHKKFPIPNTTRNKWINFIQTNILPLIAQRGYSLDWNVAGLHKTYCQKIYWYSEITAKCQELHIPLVYGSDAHSIAEVGCNFELLGD